MKKLLDQWAREIAAAIATEDTVRYQKAMSDSEEFREELVWWELLAFSNKVHYLVDHPDELK